MITVGSLFSGIGGLDLGLERAGMVVKWQVEPNLKRRAILKQEYPNAVQFHFVQCLEPYNTLPVQLICGGPPCQPFSRAGKRRGRKDDRYLWPEMRRVVAFVRPIYVLFENVPGIIGAELNSVLSDLEGLGYETLPPFAVPACAFNAEHRRDRIFVIAYSDGNRELQQEGFKPNEWRWFGNGAAKATPDTDRPRLQRGVQAGTDGKDAGNVQERHGFTYDNPITVSRDYWDYQPFLGGRVHGVPDRLHRIKALGDSVFPPAAEWLGRRIVEFDRGIR